MQYKLQKGVVQMYSKTIEILEKAQKEDKGVTIMLTSEINRKYFPVHLKFKDNTNYPFLNDTTHFSYSDVELEVDLQNNPPVVRTTIYPILEVKIKGFYTDPYFEQGSRRQPIYAYMLPRILSCEEGIPVYKESLQWKNSIAARSRV